MNPIKQTVDEVKGKKRSKRLMMFVVVYVLVGMGAVLFGDTGFVGLQFPYKPAASTTWSAHDTIHKLKAAYFNEESNTALLCVVGDRFLAEDPREYSISWKVLGAASLNYDSSLREGVFMTPEYAGGACDSIALEGFQELQIRIIDELSLDQVRHLTATLRELGIVDSHEVADRDRRNRIPRQLEVVVFSTPKNRYHTPSSWGLKHNIDLNWPVENRLVSLVSPTYGARWTIAGVYHETTQGKSKFQHPLPVRIALVAGDIIIAPMLLIAAIPVALFFRH